MADFIAVEEGASEETHRHLLRVQLLLRSIEGEAFLVLGRKEQARRCLISTNHQMTALPLVHSPSLDLATQTSVVDSTGCQTFAYEVVPGHSGVFHRPKHQFVAYRVCGGRGCRSSLWNVICFFHKLLSPPSSSFIIKHQTSRNHLRLSTHSSAHTLSNRLPILVVPRKHPVILTWSHWPTSPSQLLLTLTTLTTRCSVHCDQLHPVTRRKSL